MMHTVASFETLWSISTRSSMVHRSLRRAASKQFGVENTISYKIFFETQKKFLGKRGNFSS